MQWHQYFNALLHPSTASLTQGHLAITLAALLVLAIISGFNPLFNVEIPVLAIAWHYKNAPLLVLSLVATLGQMIAKTVLFYIGKHSKRLFSERYRKIIDKWHRWCDRHHLIKHGLTFCSALIGIPPFYIVSILLGVIRSPVWMLLVWGTLGRFLRFYIIIITALHFAKGWF